MFITRQYAFNKSNVLSSDLVEKVHQMLQRYVLLADTASSAPNYEITVTNMQNTSYKTSEIAVLSSYWAIIGSISSITVIHTLDEPGISLMAFHCTFTNSGAKISIGIDASIDNYEAILSSSANEIISAI